jgi:hypothetical protein
MEVVNELYIGVHALLVTGTDTDAPGQGLFSVNENILMIP